MQSTFLFHLSKCSSRWQTLSKTLHKSTAMFITVLWICLLSTVKSAALYFNHWQFVYFWCSFLLPVLLVPPDSAKTLLIFSTDYFHLYHSWNFSVNCNLHLRASQFVFVIIAFFSISNVFTFTSTIDTAVVDSTVLVFQLKSEILCLFHYWPFAYFAVVSLRPTTFAGHSFAKPYFCGHFLFLSRHSLICILQICTVRQVFFTFFCRTYTVQIQSSLSVCSCSRLQHRCLSANTNKQLIRRHSFLNSNCQHTLIKSRHSFNLNWNPIALNCAFTFTSLISSDSCSLSCQSMSRLSSTWHWISFCTEERHFHPLSIVLSVLPSLLSVRESCRLFGNLCPHRTFLSREWRWCSSFFYC